jgi:hypothetical protein
MAMATCHTIINSTTQLLIMFFLRAIQLGNGGPLYSHAAGLLLYPWVSAGGLGWCCEARGKDAKLAQKLGQLQPFTAACAPDHTCTPPPKWFFFVKSFYWPRGSNFSSRFQRCLGGPSGVHTTTPTRTCMLGIGTGGWVGVVRAVFAVLSQLLGAAKKTHLGGYGPGRMICCVLTGMHEPTCTFWANLISYSLRSSVRGRMIVPGLCRLLTMSRLPM